MTRLLVAGDSLLDIDLLGRVERVCPDAPVPVVDQVAEHPRPGGAALAALLAARDGHDVTLLTPLAGDDAGTRLRDLLGDAVRLAPLPYQGTTPVKRRVRVDGQSLVRIDAGGGPGGLGPLTREARRILDHALRDADAVLVSDYGHGLAGLWEFRDRVRRLARLVPVVWDPHPRGAIPVPGVRLVTPNSGELRQFADRHGVVAPGEGLAAVAGSADGLVAAWHVAAVAVTMAERGALLSYGQGAPVMLPAAAVPAGDACGAGDRFAATVAARLAAGSVTIEAVQAAVAAATGFVAEGGAGALPPRGEPAPRPAPGGPGGLDDLLTRVRAAGGTVVATGGCFDLLHAGHVATLRAARRLGDCLVVCLNSDTSVRRLKGPARPVMPAADRARVLEALECVDAVVVFDEATPEAVLARFQPDLFAKGGDYALEHLREAEVQSRWAGEVVILPYFEGRSTTRLIEELILRAD